MKKNFAVRLICSHFPGRTFTCWTHVRLGVQQRRETVWEVSADSDMHSFDVPVQVGENPDGSPNFLGPFVHGPVSGRFLYLVWSGECDGKSQMFRRTKINLQHLGWPEINAAVFSKKNIEAQVFLTDKNGGPACGTLKNENIKWLNLNP